MPASTSITAGAAGRYATALFELALEADALDQVAAGLDALDAALADSPELGQLIRNPVYTRAEQGAAMAAIADKMELGALVKNVVGLMATKRRLFALPQMIATFRAMLADHRGEVTAEVTAARALSAAQKKALAAKIKDATGRDVKLDVTIDKALIGGLVVKVGSKMVDTSIRSKLATLQNAMKEVG